MAQYALTRGVMRGRLYQSHETRARVERGPILRYSANRILPDDVASVPAAPRRNLSILVTSLNYRSFANWEPLFHRLRDQGHAVRTAFFPRVSDSDHVGLLDLEFDNVVLCPIGADFQTRGRSEERVLSELASWIEAPIWYGCALVTTAPNAEHRSEYSTCMWPLVRAVAPSFMMRRTLGDSEPTDTAAGL